MREELKSIEKSQEQADTREHPEIREDRWMIIHDFYILENTTIKNNKDIPIVLLKRDILRMK